MRCILSRGPRRRLRLAAVQEKLQSLRHFSSPAQAAPAGKLFFSPSLEVLSKFQRLGTLPSQQPTEEGFVLGTGLLALEEEEEQLFQLGSNFVRHSTSLAHGKKMHFPPLFLSA